MSSKVIQFWNIRAQRLSQEQVGTQDLIAKKLEMLTLSSYIKDGMKVLDAGCGNGTTMARLAIEHNIEIHGFDLAHEMVAAAKHTLEKSPDSHFEVYVGDVLHPPQLELYDIVYTERVLINLPSWEAQRQAIHNLGQLVAPGGLYLMMENSQDGLDYINKLRKWIGLHKIIPPWHNRYLHDSEITSFHPNTLRLQKVVNYSSTYYFLSRVVNAYLASRKGREPNYNALINRIALRLPALLGRGQGALWVWRKNDEN